ncbi:MAG: M48 family metalloprotease [Patescibacteria group bacterium]|nr:M48 family metalloprotease [Patescibacteria group bacterium]
MSVYKQINENKIKTWLIMGLFIFIFSGFFYLIGKYYGNSQGYLFLGLIISTLSSVGSYFYSDKLVLLATGARPASKRQFFDFYTTTENLAIAAGLPMPKLYVIDDETPNAFATGRDPKHAVVCATTGLLKRLDRSDIEGVVAHELSHIKNYDILLASIISVLVGAISIITDWIMRSFWWNRHHNDEENRKNPILSIIFILALILVPIAATLIQLAISRKREFLADASAVLLTRNPNGLADALEKISQYQSSKFVPSSFAHLFIVNPLNGKNSFSWLVNLFSTHPPIEERIKILRSM